MKKYPTESWTMRECAFAVLDLQKAVGRDTCIKVATMAIELMDHGKVMELFPKENLTDEMELLLAKATEAYIRAKRLRIGLN